jgi:hypothetical protein
MKWLTRLFRPHTQTRYVAATKQENTAASLRRYAIHEKLASELGMNNPVRRG